MSIFQDFFRKNTSSSNDPFLVQKTFGSKARHQSVNSVEEFLPSNYHGGLYHTSTIKKRGIITLGIILSIFMVALLGRTFYLQIAQGGDYYVLASENSTREIKITAERGIIYDRKNRPLVQNIPTYTLGLNLQKISNQKNLKDIIAKLAEIVHLPPEEMLENSENFKKYAPTMLPIKIGLTHEDALRLDVAIADIPEAEIFIDTERRYPENRQTESLSHILGYVGKASARDIGANSEYTPIDTIGKNGLELSYESVLRGNAGRKQVQIDALGREKLTIALQEAKRGSDLYLALDTELQKNIERFLRNALLQRGKQRGAAIVINPKNGEVLALVSLPAYDSNEFSRGISREAYEKLITNTSRPLFARAIQGEYPSGSTIKPLITVAALLEDVINEHTTVLSTGGIYYDRWFFPDWKIGGHGTVDLTRAIAESVNTFFYIIGGGYKNIPGLGPERMANYLTRFGLGKQTGIDLPGEADGLVPTPTWKEKTRGEEWYIGDTYHMAIGQGDILVTPIQITMAIAAIANGGTLYRPHLIQGEDAVIQENVGDAANLALVRKAMRQTVTTGSAQKLADLPYGIAGKTGTAEWKKGTSPHAWFTGFAPWNDPQVVVTVLIEEGGEGSTSAVPVARDIFQYFFTNTVAKL